MADDKREFDILIYGVTGYTGKLAARYVASTYGPSGDRVRYAFAGRNRAAIEELVENIKHDLFKESSADIPIVIVSLDNEKSLVAMCKRSKAIAALAGPYSTMGEPILKACVEGGAHYVDITGETGWVARMREKYNDEASEKHLKIVPCTGYDYVPMEMSMVYLGFAAQKFQGHEKHPTNVVQVCKSTTPSFSGGTFRSILEMLGTLTAKQLNESRMNPYAMCKLGAPNKELLSQNADLALIKYVDAVHTWAVPFMMGPGIVRYVLWANECQDYVWGKNLNFSGALSSGSFIKAIFNLLSYYAFSYFMFFLTRVSWGVTLLKKIAPPVGGGPDLSAKEQFLSVKTVATFEPVGPETAQKTSILTLGYDKGECYTMTGMSVVEAALCCALDSESTPSKFGVVTPGSALGQSYITRLQKAGVTFNIE